MTAMESSRFPWGDALAVLATKVALWTSWRDDRRLAIRLEGFAATEAGSALDMLKAAELATDPKLRKIFLRHATDEARHAMLFRRAARQVHPDPPQALSEHALIRASRQNLFSRLGLVRFIAFVHLSERRAARQFIAIARHFRDRPEIVRLFDHVLRDERYHVAYSGHLLETWKASGRRGEVRWAVWRTAMGTGWLAWRRAGRSLGDVVNRMLLLAVWALVLPVFALCERRRPGQVGWQPGSAGVASLAAARREF